MGFLCLFWRIRLPAHLFSWQLFIIRPVVIVLANTALSLSNTLLFQIFPNHFLFLSSYWRARAKRCRCWCKCGALYDVNALYLPTELRSATVTVNFHNSKGIASVNNNCSFLDVCKPRAPIGSRVRCGPVLHFIPSPSQTSTTRKQRELFPTMCSDGKSEQYIGRRDNINTFPVAAVVLATTTIIIERATTLITTVNV